jgi:hypothetical protein
LRFYNISRKTSINIWLISFGAFGSIEISSYGKMYQRRAQVINQTRHLMEDWSMANISLSLARHSYNTTNIVQQTTLALVL